MSNLFSKVLRPTRDESSVGKVVSAIKDQLNTSAGVVQRTSISGILAMESVDDSQRQELSTAVEHFQDSFKRVATTLGLESFSSSQCDAATATAMVSGNIQQFLSTPVTVKGTSDKFSTFVGLEGLQDASSTRLPAMEAYDEKDNRNAVVYSVAYNFLAGRQNEFGELFFPTVTVSNDNVGVAVSIRLVQVYDDFKRDVNGSLANYNKRNIVRAMIDSTLLKNEMTRVVPVHRAQSAGNFVAAAAVAPAPVLLEGESITTAPLAVGVELDLLGLSQTDALLANGLMDATDSLDPAIHLQNVYVKVVNGADDDVLRFRVDGLALSNFVASSQDNYKRQNLNFNTKSLMINKNTKAADGSALVALAGVVTGDLVVNIALDMTGYVNVELGNTQVFGNQIKIVSIIDPTTGNALPLNAAPASNIVAAFNATVIGYDLKAYRTNLNRRQRGQLLDTTYYNQTWAVPLRSPLSVLRPVNADAQTDTSDLAGLVSATFARTSNEAVSTLLSTAGHLKEFVDNRVNGAVAPDLFGVARMLVEPTYIGETLDVQAVINSISSHEKNSDIQAVLVNKIRDIGYRLFRDSGFQAVVDSKAAGVEGNPVIMVGTDPMTARYLMVDGDQRMAGPDFEYKVVTSPDLRMQGKLVIALGYPTGGENRLNPMHFGNMLWSPEVTLVIPVSRSGQISKELTVQPRFRHIVNVPVMGMVEVSGIPGVVSTKTSIDFHEVP